MTFQFGLYERPVAVHRCKTVPTVLGVVGRESSNGRGPRGPARSPDRDEVRDQKIRQAANTMDQQSFRQAERQTGNIIMLENNGQSIK